MISCVAAQDYAKGREGWKKQLRRQKMQKILKRRAKHGRRWRKCATDVECV